MPIPALAPVERLLLDWVAGMGVCGVEILEPGVVDEEEDEDGDREIGDGEVSDVGFEEGDIEEDEGSDGDVVDCVMLEDWIRC